LNILRKSLAHRESLTKRHCLKLGNDEEGKVGGFLKKEKGSKMAGDF
jgi:hypothetical protein